MHYQCLILDDELELAQMTCEYFQMFDVSCSYVGSVAEYEAFMQENGKNYVEVQLWSDRYIKNS